ncbi:MAG: hypothetical protein IIV28_05330, partial [Alistipes sp.]|nr:hypothetical protein [Alistipes sp.]
SDQNCPPTKGCCWHDFLRHDSLFFDGGELLAMKFGLPVYYLELERIEAVGTTQLLGGETLGRASRLGGIVSTHRSDHQQG